MFTAENTREYTTSDLELLNQALALCVESGMDEKTASDRITNNWHPSGNTIESLARPVCQHCGCPIYPNAFGAIDRHLFCPGNDRTQQRDDAHAANPLLCSWDCGCPTSLLIWPR